MRLLLQLSPYFGALILGLLLGVASMIRGVDRHLARRGRLSVLNMPTIGAFFTVFGAVGYPVAKYSRLPAAAVLLIAALGGIAGAVGVYILIAGWAVPAAAHDVEDPRYVLQGHFARVTEAIRSDAPGRIVYEQNGAAHAVSARGLDGQAIDRGAEVVIERIENDVAYVELWSNIERELQLPA
jgi:hypothetical protein